MNYCFIEDAWNTKSNPSNKPNAFNVPSSTFEKLSSSSPSSTLGGTTGISNDKPKINIDAVLQNNISTAPSTEQSNDILKYKMKIKKLKKKMSQDKNIIKGVDDKYLFIGLLLLFLFIMNN
jgi:hypothetical protein